MIKFIYNDLSAAGSASRMVGKELAGLLALANLTVLGEVVANKATATNGNSRLFVVGEALSKGHIFMRQQAPRIRYSLSSLQKDQTVALEVLSDQCVDIYIGRYQTVGDNVKVVHHLHLSADINYSKEVS